MQGADLEFAYEEQSKSHPEGKGICVKRNSLFFFLLFFFFLLNQQTRPKHVSTEKNAICGLGKQRKVYF